MCRALCANAKENMVLCEQLSAALFQQCNKMPKKVQNKIPLLFFFHHHQCDLGEEAFQLFNISPIFSIRDFFPTPFLESTKCVH